LNKVILILFQCVMIFSQNVLANGSDKSELFIKLLENDDKSIIQLDVMFKFEKDKSVYKWRGHIYPILGYLLYPEVKTDSGKLLNVIRYEKVMPKIPHPADMETGKEVIYEKPLKLIIENFNRESYKGCLSVRLLYDAEKLVQKSKLSKLRIWSNMIDICK